MKTKELREKPVKDLQRHADKLRVKLAESARAGMGEIKNVREVRAMKRDLARTLTLIKQKQE